MNDAIIWKNIFRRPSSECKKHDWDMIFPDPENPLAWKFVCSKCLKERFDMPSPMEMI